MVQRVGLPEITWFQKSKGPTWESDALARDVQSPLSWEAEERQSTSDQYPWTDHVCSPQHHSWESLSARDSFIMNCKQY